MRKIFTFTALCVSAFFFSGCKEKEPVKKPAGYFTSLISNSLASAILANPNPSHESEASKPEIDEDDFDKKRPPLDDITMPETPKVASKPQIANKPQIAKPVKKLTGPICQCPQGGTCLCHEAGYPCLCTKGYSTSNINTRKRTVKKYVKVCDPDTKTCRMMEMKPGTEFPLETQSGSSCSSCGNSRRYSSSRYSNGGGGRFFRRWRN